jgi:hypothetical protein
MQVIGLKPRMREPYRDAKLAALGVAIDPAAAECWRVAYMTRSTGLAPSGAN